MARTSKSKRAAEFGDFQTPMPLARKVCATLLRQGLEPATILEPTCGEGAFLRAALEGFATASKALGLEINPSYVEFARAQLRNSPYQSKAEILKRDFFATDWCRLIATLSEPILVIGNPPWVTKAALGVLGSSNLPDKSNFQSHTGLDAITGKSNFDIAEWMLIKLLDCLNGREATVAMLCKTAVARKVLLHVWKNSLSLKDSSVHRIDAREVFGAAVDACLLVCNLSASRHSQDCDVYQALGDVEKAGAIGYRDGRLLADVPAYERLKHLRGDEVYRWRSGMKHDCGKVMEFHKEGRRYRNGLGELVELEDEYLYPMLKSSQLANATSAHPKRWVLVTQRSLSDDTAMIARTAPKTWEYLVSHAERLDGRRSSIYRNRPRFSVFGVGDYSFAPHKVAISGLHKRLRFAEIGTSGGKPILLGDTSYFVSCRTREEASFIASLLNSEVAKDFFSAFIFWDAKRPITIEILRQLDLTALAKELGSSETLAGFLKRRKPTTTSRPKQGVLFKQPD